MERKGINNLQQKNILEEYPVIVFLGKSEWDLLGNYEKVRDMIGWVSNEFNYFNYSWRHYSVFGPGFRFKNKEDAIYFKLMWYG